MIPALIEAVLIGMWFAVFAMAVSLMVMIMREQRP